jgi:hypothetical protein
MIAMIMAAAAASGQRQRLNLNPRMPVAPFQWVHAHAHSKFDAASTGTTWDVMRRRTLRDIAFVPASRVSVPIIPEFHGKAYDVDHI